MHQIDPTVTYIIIGALIAYIAATALLTVKLRSRDSSDFMVAARSMPAIVVGILMMSEFVGAKSTIGTAQAAFESGSAAMWAVLSAAIGFPLFGIFLAKKLYTSGEFTISGAVAKRYGRSTQITVSLIMIYALLLVNVGYYVSGAAALSTILNIPLGPAAIVTAVVSTFYCAIGGMKSVAYVSVVHTVVKCVGVAVVLGVALTLSGGIRPMLEHMPQFNFSATGKIGFPTIFAWSIANIGAIFSTQYIIQAVSSLRSANSARTSTYIAGALCIPVSIALGLIGVAAKYLFPGMKSLYAFPVFMTYMSPLLAAIVAISLAASVFVGVCSVCLAISSLIVKDFYSPMRHPSPDQEFRMSRLLAIPIGFVPLAFVFFFPEVLHLSFFTRAIRLSIAVVAVLGFYLPLFSSSRGATLGLLCAVLATTAWYAMGDPYGIDNIYIALAAPPIVMALDRLFPKAADKRQVAPITNNVE
ncbi:sodium:solute symporter family protein [Caballeronia sp. INML2]|uniref:sodium:solute symporter family protein n=1 Tax=Caballeronia sp. INML2 TaxID=2921748 RepID=UPI00202810C0|nr:sodium:solute symporter family protein [Caballeronia sp. INML2]